VEADISHLKNEPKEETAFEIEEQRKIKKKTKEKRKRE